MKHLKIYEEYSDDDLKDLIGDLETVGHKHRLVQGEDFGFGPDLKGKNDGKTILFLTSWAVDQLGKTDLVYNQQLTWPKWPEYKGSYYENVGKIPIPQLRRSRDLDSLEYPPKTGFFSGKRESIVAEDLWFVSLTVTSTGRNFPLSPFDSSNMFISPKKVAPTYDIIVDKIKNVNI